MKFETGTLNLVIKPEHDGDVYNLGVISTKLKCKTEFTATIDGDIKDTRVQCNALLVKYDELIEFLISASKI